MSIQLSLADAATNCQRDGAIATLTLKSGVQLIGNLQRASNVDLDTCHMHIENGGWITCLVDEIAAVGVARRNT